MNQSIQIISIEGNIGSGKSTLLANLKKHFSNKDGNTTSDNSINNIIFLKEPVDEWANIKDENGVTILEKFYADQYKYSFSFQMMAYISRLKLLRDTIRDIQRSNSDPNQNTNTHYTIITERSLYTDKMVFAKMLYDNGKIEHVNYQIYLNWFNTFAEEFPVNKIVYVKADPDICYERISKRNREGESNIPVDYLKSCNKYHDNMLDKSSPDCVCHEQLVLDGNNDIYEDESILHHWISSIEAFLLKN